MKSRFSTIDIAVIVQELKRFLGMRVVNVYDIDNKTYLIRVGKPDEKDVILIESGIRLHSTEFDWPKNPAPSGFSMKLRKHLKGRRFESIRQLGIDRIVDLQFGSGEAAYHVIVELYDRGNIVLTDFEFTILNILRPRTDNSQDVRFAVREIYPVDSGKEHHAPTLERLQALIQSGKDGDVLKKLLVPHLDYGPAIIDHVLLGAGFKENVKIGQGFHPDADMSKLLTAIEEAESLLQDFISKPCKGHIIQKKDQKPSSAGAESGEILLYEEFHPFLLRQHRDKPMVEFERFDRSVDEFFSKLESQRLDLKVIQQEKTALKKLDNVKKDHEKRIQGLQKEQESDVLRGQLIEMNLDLVDQAILIVRSAVANQIDWTEIWNLVKEAQLRDDPVASTIKALKLDTNQITLLLHDPYVAPTDGDDSDTVPLKPMRVDIDLALSAYGNSRKYFDKKRQAAKKQQKTVEASNKAFKSAEKKTKQTLKDVAVAASINKTRKTYWFEKFLWFISSENYLVIGGRDQQQNEIIVKRYMRPGDLYVHADLHGASSCVVKNPTGEPVPPKTLNEAGTMAICNSAAWDSKVVTSAWWVHHDQVSKTAPSGEYLTTGSFMIRGKKNYLPPSYLVYGFGFVFKLEEGSIERHLGERKVRAVDDDAMSVTDSTVSSVPGAEDVDIEISDDSDEDDDNDDAAGAENKTDAAAEGDKSKVTDSVSDDVPLSSAVSPEAGATSAPAGAPKEEVKEDVVEQKAGAAGGGDDGDDADDMAFPDTNIALTHVKGDKYELQREVSTTSTVSEASDVFDLGDGVPVSLGQKTSSKTGKISAKQRRDMKKGKKGKGGGQEDEEEDQVSWLHPSKQEKEEDAAEGAEEEGESKEKGPQGVPPKRGQRAKLKKMKEKYADQDEEERRLRMEILASSGAQKEEKKKKGKKGKEPPPPAKSQRPGSSQKPPANQVKAQGQKVQQGDGASQTQTVPADSADTSHKSLDRREEKDPKPKASAKEDHESDGEKEEEGAAQDDMNILNSLTGLPVTEDELLFAIPMCAPYNAILSYKYKVKLMPGSTKKGKAVKTALNMFVHEKSASPREKDLLKIQKDVDLSRNVPGKVKVAAPNLHKNKR
ncbi:nuclear export mediator factor Nemf [Aplysia californica]|uniref:Nuclear export mediator factor Nemf n=1 Tax=Aplysia californica TaxID=6500 RepID=A0ABM0JRG7_APLCA|nr:nuclear export mediator factor Nemf [Aplysia californica]